jgi:signal transduction histidine kinase
MSAALKSLSEEEKQWEKEKDDMICNISHDLRTPLTSVIGYLQLIINQAKEKQDEQLLSYVNISYSKCMEIKLLTEQLFDYAKITNKEYQPVAKQINLSELVKQVVLGLMPQLNEKKLTCRLNLPDEKVFITADAALMARVFDNLLNNAMKYGADGSFIDIDIRLAEKENKVTVMVTNYGSTILPEDLPYIFNRFYCIDKSRSSENSGTGLGLAIVKSIIERHHGTICVQSENDKTVFEICLSTFTGG